jgi:hypothetical protein
LDFDNDSKINFKQLQQSLHEVYTDVDFDEHFQTFFTMMNPDVNGKISFEDWCKFLIFFPKNNFQSLIAYLDTMKEKEKLQTLEINNDDSDKFIVN